VRKKGARQIASLQAFTLHIVLLHTGRYVGGAGFAFISRTGFSNKKYWLSAG